MKKLFLSILFLNAWIAAMAQAVMPQETESVFRSSGKIYVVVGIIAIIFILIVLYLLRLDKKISKLENKHK